MPSEADQEASGGAALLPAASRLVVHAHPARSRVRLGARSAGTSLRNDTPSSSHGERATAIVGIGIDLLEVSRMEQELERDGAGFIEQVFFPGESAYCEARHHPAQHYAARFAAKEAVFKALALEGADTAAWRQVEIRSRRDGSRHVVLHGRLKELAERRGVRRVWLSMTHTRSLAAASVLLES